MQFILPNLTNTLKTRKCFVLFIFLIAHQYTYSQNIIDVKAQIKLAEQQFQLMLQTHPDKSKIPYSSLPSGALKDTRSSGWCSGFFGGSLWYLFEYTKNPKWKEAADLWTMAVQKEQYNVNTHDLGFMLYCSFGNGYRLTKNANYRKILLQGAESLSSRFDPKIGLIESWNKFKGYDYPVIIDNMMNLEFLLWAAKDSENQKFLNLSVSHADKTLKNHFRKDNSSYHVVTYDSVGKALAKMTHQGAGHETAWARGQAWGLYGYTVMYRETKDNKYLKHANKIAEFILNHPTLPADKIPYWDFNAPNLPNEERDASAAAIIASSLLELSQYTKESKSKNYFKIAEIMLKTLSSPEYWAKTGENNNFLLKHSVGNKPEGNEIDKPLSYADYYYLEALIKYDRIKNKSN